MPRPSKQVSPDTLGGRIRAARQALHLSLMEVASGRYSTSLISQIERNRVDPSQESLKFLAERLELPIEELVTLSMQHRETEAEAQKYKEFETQWTQANQLRLQDKVGEAVDELSKLDLTRVPFSLRWRMAALRGECYFALRQFADAQSDFFYAVREAPKEISPDHHLETLLLNLHLAASYRELNLFANADRQYQIALHMMSASTSLRYVAEAHWGMALVASERAKSYPDEDPGITHNWRQDAKQHTESALALYQAIGDNLNAAALSCQLALMAQEEGNIAQARQRLKPLLTVWEQIYANAVSTSTIEIKQRQAYANIVSAIACYLADIEMAANDHGSALNYITKAQEFGQKSYAVRRAEAGMLRGRILDARGKLSQDAGKVEEANHDFAEAEEAFRQAIEEVRGTERRAYRARAHNLLGRFLLKHGRDAEGDKELDMAEQMSKDSFTSVLQPTEVKN